MDLFIVKTQSKKFTSFSASFTVNGQTILINQYNGSSYQFREYKSGNPWTENMGSTFIDTVGHPSKDIFYGITGKINFKKQLLQLITITINSRK